MKTRDCVVFKLFISTTTVINNRADKRCLPLDCSNVLLTRRDWRQALVALTYHRTYVLMTMVDGKTYALKTEVVRSRLVCGKL